MQAAVRQLLVGIGQDPMREGLKDTPKRVCKALMEMTSGYDDDPAAILRTHFNSEAPESLVVVRGIEFWSLCEHHLLPFHGTADVAYVPRNGKVVGLSKLARLVQCYAKRLQLQERMTAEIVRAMNTHMNPKGAGVVVRAKHACMACRGVKVEAEMLTVQTSGVLLKDTRERSEFMLACYLPQSQHRGS